ncbi:MAG TPA: TolC family protein [Polyangiaceae bacterium]|nr:TolC family protein [Polyangiaceae bacterium]
MITTFRRFSWSSPASVLAFTCVVGLLPPSARAQTPSLPIAGEATGVLDAPRPPPTLTSAGGPEATEKMTFDESVRRAASRNPTLLVAREEVARLEALMEQVRASALPSLTGAGTYTRLDSDRVSGGLVVQPESALNLSVTLTVPLVHPRGWLDWSHAGEQIDVARTNEADVKRTIAVATARAYLTILTQKRLVETARIARDNAKAHYEFTRAQRVGGVGNRLDEARAAQELTTDEVNLQNQSVALVRTREALGVLVAASGPVDTADEATPSQMPTFADALAEAEHSRADVRARQRARTAADRTVRDAWADYAPYLDLVAYPFYQTPATPTVPRTGWQAELVLTVPLYDGSRYGREHERVALASEARLDAEATLRQARSDVRVAFEAMRRSDAALDQAAQSASFARRALELANLAYRAGATTNLEVIDAERQARDAETLAAIAEDAAREARLGLLAASGRFP